MRIRHTGDLAPWTLQSEITPRMSAAVTYKKIVELIGQKDLTDVDNR